jgi:hypothetical protein
MKGQEKTVMEIRGLLFSSSKTTTMDPQQNIIDRNRKAIKYLDLLFPYLPEYAEFEVSHIIHLNNLDKEADDYSQDIKDVMSQKLGYTNDSDYWITLTDAGRAAKAAGGHTAYLLKQREEKSLQMRKLKIDVKNAERVFKTYWWTLALAVASFCLSVGLGILRLLGI